MGARQEPFEAVRNGDDRWIEVKGMRPARVKGGGYQLTMSMVGILALTNTTALRIAKIGDRINLAQCLSADKLAAVAGFERAPTDVLDEFERRR